MTTASVLDLDTKEGKKFLRRVLRNRHEEWRLSARESEEWRVLFWRRVPARDAGDRDGYVSVPTDIFVKQYGNTGHGVKPFDDARPVTVPKCTSVTLHEWDVRTVAKLLLDGPWGFEVSHSAGSTSSSQYGLAFIRLSLHQRTGGDWHEVQIGSESVFIHGSRIVAGSCDVS